MNKKKFDILIADNDEQISYLLNFLLTREGYTVKVTSDGKEALETIDTINAPKLILLDIILPHYTGYQIIEHIREKPNWDNVPILMVTAQSSEKDIVKALKIGANDCMIKPFQPRELISRLKMLTQES